MVKQWAEEEKSMGWRMVGSTKSKAALFKTLEMHKATNRKCDPHARTHRLHTHIHTHAQWRQGVTESVWRLFNEGSCVLRLRRLALLTSLSCLSR